MSEITVLKVILVLFILWMQRNQYSLCYFFMLVEHFIAFKYNFVD